MDQHLLETQSSWSKLHNGLLELRENIDNILVMMDNYELAIQPNTVGCSRSRQTEELGHKVLIFDTKTGRQRNFNSIRSAAKFIGKNESTVRGHLKLHSTYEVNNYRLSYPSSSVNKLP